MSDSQIKEFYLNIRRDGHPIIDDVLNGDHDFLEANHNWCQRAYPNFEESQVVPGSPVLDDETLEFLATTQREKILLLVFRMLKHCGELRSAELHHNCLRITRLLKFLKLANMPDVAAGAMLAFCGFLNLAHGDMATTGQDFDMYHYVKYWDAAMKYNKGDKWIVPN